MKISYFDDTDTLYIELKSVPIAQSRDLDEDTLIDVDEHGHVVGITLEHASRRTGLAQVQLTGIAA